MAAKKQGGSGRPRSTAQLEPRGRLSGRSKSSDKPAVKTSISSAPDLAQDTLPNLPMQDLVKAVDVATAFVSNAAVEVQGRVSRSIHTALSVLSVLPTPSLLAEAASGIVQAILGDERLRQRVLDLEENVQFTVDPRTRSGMRLKTMRGRIHECALNDLKPDESALDETVEALKKAGFAIIRIGRFGITASGHARLVSDVLGMPVSVCAAPRGDGFRATKMFAATQIPPMPSDLFVSPKKSLSVDGSRFHTAINDFVFIPPPLLLATNANAPAVPFAHLDEAAVRRLLRIPTSGKFTGLTGKGVKLAMIDSGFSVDHGECQASCRL